MCTNGVADGYLLESAQTDNTKLGTVLSLLESFCAVDAHAAWLVYTLLLGVSPLVWHIEKVLLKTLCVCAQTPHLMMP